MEQRKLPHLTAAEQDHLDRAHAHLARTDLLADKPPRGINRELLYEGRFAARGVVEMAQQLSLERSSR